MTEDNNFPNVYDSILLKCHGIQFLRVEVERELMRIQNEVWDQAIAKACAICLATGDWADKDSIHKALTEIKRPDRCYKI